MSKGGLLQAIGIDDETAQEVRDELVEALHFIELIEEESGDTELAVGDAKTHSYSHRADGDALALGPDPVLDGELDQLERSAQGGVTLRRGRG